MCIRDRGIHLVGQLPALLLLHTAAYTRHQSQLEVACNPAARVPNIAFLFHPLLYDVTGRAGAVHLPIDVPSARPDNGSATTGTPASDANQHL